MSADVKKFGDWVRVEALIGDLANMAQKAKEVSLMNWGLKAEGLAKKHINNQDLGWKELDIKYLASKIRKGYSENILVRTSDYFQAITSWVDTPNETVYAGVKKAKMDVEGHIIADIAAVHEYGTKDGRIPARPLWQPVFEETMKWFKTSDYRPDVLFMKYAKLH